MTPVASLKLTKGGKYVVWATLYYKTTGSGGDAVRCKLTSGETTGGSWASISRSGQQSMAASVVGTFPARGSVALNWVAATEKTTANDVW